MKELLEKVKCFLRGVSKRNWIIVGCAAVVLVAGITAVCLSAANRPQPLAVVQDLQEGSQDVDSSDPAASAQPYGAVIYVHIKGAVQSPGLLELPEGARVNDAVEAAGGAAEDADVNQVNLAQPLSDGDQIYIPTKREAENEPTPAPGISSAEETKAASSGKTANSRSAGEAGSGKSGSSGEKEVLVGKVNINTDSSERLQLLPGIGPALAQRIIDYRSKTPFQTIEDLKNVSGIGDKTFEKMKDKLEV